MAAPGATQLRSLLVASLLDRFECWLHVNRTSYSALATELPLPRNCWFVISQVTFLCGDAGHVHLSDRPPLSWAGGITAFLATPLLLRTATSRGKDDHHRGPFLHAGGEIYFRRSEFWTAGKGSESTPAFKCSSGAIGREQTPCDALMWSTRPVNCCA